MKKGRKPQGSKMSYDPSTESVTVERPVEKPVENLPKGPPLPPPIPFDAGEIHADVKITKIVPENERSVYFVKAMRNPNTGAILTQPLLDKKGQVRGSAVIWDEKNEECMTPQDFDSFVRDRASRFMIPDEFKKEK